MENASKALIIAGAILIAIVLITLAVAIVGKGQQAVDNNDLSQNEIAAFNNKVLKYEKERIGGAEVKSLISEVISSNSDPNNQSMKALIKITIDGKAITNTDGKGGTAADASSLAVNNKKYKVVVSKYSTAGRVSEVTITTNPVT